MFGKLHVPKKGHKPEPDYHMENLTQFAKNETFKSYFQTVCLVELESQQCKKKFL